MPAEPTVAFTVRSTARRTASGIAARGSGVRFAPRAVLRLAGDFAERGAMRFADFEGERFTDLDGERFTDFETVRFALVAVVRFGERDFAGVRLRGAAEATPP
jgi:hypothetical protein